MSLMFQPLRRYADFMGRASRTEFWLFQLFILVLALAIFIPLVVTAGSRESGSEPPVLFTALFLLGIAAYLALFIPRLALMVRRLHDSGNSGFWVLVSLVPGGGLIMLVFMLLPGTVGANRHGQDPRGRPEPTTRQATMTLDSVA